MSLRKTQPEIEEPLRKTGCVIKRVQKLRGKIKVARWATLANLEPENKLQSRPVSEALQKPDEWIQLYQKVHLTTSRISSLVLIHCVYARPSFSFLDTRRLACCPSLHPAWISWQRSRISGRLGGAGSRMAFLQGSSVSTIPAWGFLENNWGQLLSSTLW